MFKIVDGREYFYQWDLDRQIAVEDNSIAEVHFCNRTDECSLVVEVKDGLANVPNLILQKHFDIRVFGYDGKATRYDEVFKVKPRTKPADYVYTETEIKNYDDLVARIDEIEKNGVSEEVITEAVENYLEKNPVDLTGYATEDYVDEAVKNVEVDLTGYATKEYVDKAIENIDIPEPEKVDLTDYAKKSDIPSVEGLATEQYVDDAIANIEIPEATSTEGAYHLVFPEADYAVITDEKTIEYMNLVEAGKFACAYITGYGVNGYGKDAANYAIDYVEKDELNSRTYKLYTGMSVTQSGSMDVRPLTYYIINIWKDHDGNWTKSYINENTNNFVTNTYVKDSIQTAIDNLEIPEGGDGDLSNYYTKEDIDAMFEGIATAEGGAY